MVPLRVLVVAAAPDARASTEALRRIVASMDAVDELDATVWFLRGADELLAGWPEPRVIDRLRTWGPARALDLLGLRVAADRLRGARLRQWLAEADPHVVILDDAVGERVVQRRGSSVALAVRLNEALPDDWMLEQAVSGPAVRLTIVPEDDAPATSGPTLAEPRLLDGRFVRAALTPRSRSSVRDEHDLPADAPLLVGWGVDDWLDGSDLFVRMLWQLEQRHGLRAHGLWFGSKDATDRERTLAEAERCGVADRYHRRVIRATDDDAILALACSADAVFLPSRDVVIGGELLPYLDLAGIGVVAFDCADLAPPVVTVDNLDLDDAAQRLHDLMTVDRDRRIDTARTDWPAKEYDTWVRTVLNPVLQGLREVT